jgi:hypothetical protein
MTTPTPTSKAELSEFFRQACTSAMLGRALPLRSPEWKVLSPLELEAAEQMMSVLARMPEEWFSASLLASRARAVFAKAGWPELSLLGRSSSCAHRSSYTKGSRCTEARTPPTPSPK